MKIPLAGAFSFLTFFALGQTGPGGVGDVSTNVLWLTADYGVYTDVAGTTPASGGDNVANWRDRSGNGHNAISATLSQRPNLQNNVVNGMPALRFTAGNGDQILSTLTTSTGGQASVWAVAAWSSLPSQNPGIIHAAPSGLPFSTSPGDKTIGMWVSSGSSMIWGRGIQSNNTTVDIPQTTATSSNTFYSFLNLYNGSQIIQYVNHVAAGSVNYNGTLQSWAEFGIGSQAAEGWNGDITEVIAFNVAVNSAQRIIVNNYLAAKYGLTLTANDVYTVDNPASGNYDYDVAGIGRVDASNTQSDSRGSGIVRVSDPSNLGNNEFFMWGHDNGSLDFSVTTGLPSTLTARMVRQWRVSESGDVGSVDMDFDLTGISMFASMNECNIATVLRLLVDVDGDGSYSDETPISGAIGLGNNTYRFENVTAISNNDRFTLGIYTTASVDGPGGVGGTSGPSSLVLWLDANRVSGSNGATMTTWNDASPYENHFTSGNGAVFNTSGVNGYPTFSFNGSSHYFERPYSSTLMPSSLTLLAAVNVTSSSLYKAVFSNRDDPPGNETRGFILYSDPTSNNWDFWNGHASIAWQQTTSSVSTAGSWASVTASYDGGTGAKELYIRNTLGANNIHSMAPNLLQPVRVGAGRNEDTPDYYFLGQMGEVILYNTVLNSAQRIIVNNYLAAKYNFTLTANDIYDEDNAGNGNFDHEVAGIGQVDASNRHDDAKGGIVRISNPSNLGNNEFLLWGHNNGSLNVTSTTDLPTGIQGKLSRIWRVSEVNASGGAINVGDIDIEFDLGGWANVNPSHLRLLIDHDGDGIFNEGMTGQVSVTSSNTTCGLYVFRVTGGSLTDGDRFTLGTTNIIQTPLPIELISFAGSMSNGNATLTWKTLTETNNHFFTIERSLDGKTFQSVGEVQGSGTTKEQVSYAYVDYLPPSAVLYYRLKQTDFDGAYTYSDVIRVNNAGLGTQLVAMPNPVNSDESLIIRIRHHENVDMRTVHLRVYDIVGHEVAISGEVENNELRIKFPDQRPGVYIITAVSPQIGMPLMTRVVRR